MTAPAQRMPVALTIQSSSLGQKVRLNQGANGTIWGLKGLQLPDSPGDLVYKEYLGPAKGVALHGLISILDARLRLPPDRRKTFDELTVWPLRVVVDDQGRPAGVLMRIIPDDFWETIKLPSGKKERIPREVQHLIFDPATARLRDVAVPADNDLRTRIRICERLAFVVGILHGSELVYGDLSARNILYRLGPHPSVLLVDCDAARVKGSGAVNKQQDSPDWDPPETQRARAGGGPANQTQDTDRYKLALFVLRCVTPGRGSSVNREWSAAASLLDAKGRELVTLALEGKPDERPRAREWVQYLRARLGEGPMPPMKGARTPPPPRPPSLGAPAGSGSAAKGWRRDAHGQWIQG